MVTTLHCMHTPCDLSLDVILFTQSLCEITEGDAREEIQSSVNYLFFVSTSSVYGKNPQISQGIV